MEFWESQKDAEKPLREWEKKVKSNEWTNWGELKQTFGSADQVGSCTVFDVGNNRWRLIARINYRRGLVYTLKVMTHADYDRKDPRNRRRSLWESECGCHEPPPTRKARS
ncbi:type II toxin-antitoxin system HigB family toxin [Paludisphaera rhizosphaerae]